MAKNVLLIITSKSEITVAWQERERYVKEFCDALQERVSKFRVLFTTYQDLQFIVRNNLVEIYDTRNDISLADVAWANFKNWTFELEEASTIAAFFEKRRIPYANSEVNSGVAHGKISQMVRLADENIPVPDTIYMHRELIKSMFKTGHLPVGFVYPLILKADDGSKGDDNYLIKNANDALEVLNSSKGGKEYVLQNFVPNDGDFRLLFIGLETDPLIFRRIAVTGSHLNNTSKGGSGEFIAKKDFPAEFLIDASRAAQTLRREISGVDIIVNKETGKHYVLEVNATPAMATGYGLEEKLQKYADFANSSLEVQEEEE